VNILGKYKFPLITVEKERKVQQSIEEKEIQVEELGKLEIVFKRFYICLGKKVKGYQQENPRILP